jgi:hypothetical protein
MHYQVVYTAAELTAAGFTPNAIIEELGWNVTGAPLYALPNYTIRMDHTTNANSSTNISTAGMTQVYNSASYTPAAGGFDMLVLSTPFIWNGTDNIVVDVCFDQVSPTYNSSGQVSVYGASSGSRYVRSDASSQCGVFTSSTLTYKPVVQFLISSAAGEPPVIQCPVDVVVSNDADQCGAIVNFADAVAIDPDGDLDVVLQTAGLPSGSEFPVGVNTVEFTAYDLGGNQSTCTFTITVEDIQDPVIECLSEYTIELGTSGEYTIDPEELLASFSDNCGIVSYEFGGALIPEARSLATLFAGGNGGGTGGAVFFDVSVTEDITMTGLLTHLQAVGGATFSVDIYAIAGDSYVGNEQNPGAWTLIGTATGTPQGAGTPSEAFLSSGISLNAGTDYAMALVLDANHAHSYTNGN